MVIKRILGWVLCLAIFVPGGASLAVERAKSLRVGDCFVTPAVLRGTITRNGAREPDYSRYPYWQESKKAVVVIPAGRQVRIGGLDTVDKYYVTYLALVDGFDFVIYLTPGPLSFLDDGKEQACG